jgi:phosphatidylglycerol:prolipoprotein diacylglycerol transferase
MLLGGRLGYVIFYGRDYFLAHPEAIFSPYVNGNYVGIFGMSFHGALLGVVLGSWIFLKIKKINFWDWSDFVVPTVSLGYFFGRIGNFFNGELFGKLANTFWGMHFFADPTNMRYPSQLVEASLEGAVLFLFFWKIRNKKKFKGKLFCLYLIAYGCMRTISEQFRAPDPQLGDVLGGLTMGQILSLAMILMGAFFWFQKNKSSAILRK